MAVPLSNTFEGGTNGVTITSGNSGGASGNAWNTVTIGTGYTVTYANTPTLSQGMCAAITAGATSAQGAVDWRSTEVGTIGPTIYTRHYMRYSAFPFDVNNRLLYLTVAGTPRCGMLVWGTNTADSGKFTWSDTPNAGGTSSTTTLSVNTTYRFECLWTLSASVGQVVINCYAGDSTTPLETLTSPASQNFGGTTMDSVTWGYNSSGTSTNYPGTLYIDGCAIGTTGYFGPIGTPVTSTFSVNF